MGIHPSLKVDAAGVQQRSVLTRIERIKDLMKKGLWEENRVTGLPKTKIIKIKSRKAKAAKEETAAGAEGAAAGAATGAAAPAKTAAAPAAKDKKPAAK